MNFKDPKNILEFIRFQKHLLYKYKDYIKNLMQKDYKKAAILVYWLKDYLRYIKAEKTFRPKQLINYKRGQIVFVNFGFRIGKELGGLHYAIVLDVKNQKNSNTMTVLPLRSQKEHSSRYQDIYTVPLGNILPELLIDKATEMAKAVSNELDHISKTYSIDVIKKDKDIQTRVRRLRRQSDDSVIVLSYITNLKSHSIADVGQITTISKQRVKLPVHKNDVLSDIIIPDYLMKEIEDKIKYLYIGCKK